MNLRARSFTAAAIIALLLVLIGAFGASTSAQEDVYSERTVEIGRKLACPVCQGQTVADSHSRVALEMMLAIDAQVKAGRTDEEIYDYFRARYGDEVLVEPPHEGINLALWWLPVGAVVLGLGVVALYFRDSVALGRGLRRQREEPADPELEQLARRVLNDADPETT
ncbi:MAG: cytochrome c-type biogenesis protein [Thermomicrobiales bacterium]